MDGSLAEHKQVTVYNHIFQKDVDVDEDIAELMSLVWGLGLGTDASCQEMKELNDGTLGAYIGFVTVSDAELFMNIVLEYIPRKNDLDNQSTYQRIIRQGGKPCWEIEVSPVVVGKGDSERIVFSAFVIFPKEDIQVIVEALKIANSTLENIEKI